MKKFISMVAFFILFWTWLAFDANLSVNQTIADINQPIKLTLKISDDTDKPITVQQIKWLENFNIVWQNQFQSTSSQITVINWKTKAVNTTNYTIILLLQAKNPGNYTIWPAIIKLWNKTIRTNSVKVKITWQKIMLNNTQSSNNLSFSNNNPSKNSLSINTGELQISPAKIKTQNDYLPQILFWISLLILIWIAILIYVLKSWKEKETYISTKINSQTNENISISNNSNLKTISDNSQNSYDLADELWFLSSKYWIENYQTKTYSEILQELNKKWITLQEQEEELLKNYLLYPFKKQ